ncbi:hypothetical protein HMPREF9436_02868 [Faecalibacterium cf. prausnitzii KLE1255]|uniref:Uncharacterized protein n=1 Tax=Faecalibacterium cf. prausnitzii KLE1255 TaxID=748224 RepID=E2ZMF0_9FIRM|nr:hypothetical protein HMPREF9436_02868 [Faecalibacterium cf. prausnitzii KLE1255]
MGRGPQRSTIIPERSTFVKDFFEKNCIFSKSTCLRFWPPNFALKTVQNP